MEQGQEQVEQAPALPEQPVQPVVQAEQKVEIKPEQHQQPPVHQQQQTTNSEVKKEAVLQSEPTAADQANIAPNVEKVVENLPEIIPKPVENVDELPMIHDIHTMENGFHRSGFAKEAVSNDDSKPEVPLQLEQDDQDILATDDILNKNMVGQPGSGLDEMTEGVVKEETQNIPELTQGESTTPSPSSPQISREGNIPSNHDSPNTLNDNESGSFSQVLATSASTLTAMAGAHATQVNSSPEDMEFNRIKSTYTNLQGDFILENNQISSVKSPQLSNIPIISSMSSINPVMLSTPVLKNNEHKQMFTQTQVQSPLPILDYEIIDGTKIYDDGRVEIVPRQTTEVPDLVFEVEPSKTIEKEPQMMTSQPQQPQSVQAVEQHIQVPDIQSSLVVETNSVDSEGQNN